MASTLLQYADMARAAGDNRKGSNFDALVLRVRAEFCEMPGLSVTFPEAMRLWGVSSDVCQEIIDVLVGRAFLQWTPNGRIMRADRAELRHKLG